MARDRLDPNRFIVCPLESKKYMMEVGKDVCPVCGEKADEDGYIFRHVLETFHTGKEKK